MSRRRRAYALPDDRFTVLLDGHEVTMRRLSILAWLRLPQLSRTVCALLPPAAAPQEAQTLAYHAALVSQAVPGAPQPARLLEQLTFAQLAALAKAYFAHCDAPENAWDERGTIQAALPLNEDWGDALC